MATKRQRGYDIVSGKENADGTGNREDANADLGEVRDFLRKKCRFDDCYVRKYSSALISNGYTRDIMHDLVEPGEFDDIEKSMPIGHRKRILKMLNSSTLMRREECPLDNFQQNSVTKKQAHESSSRETTYIDKAGYLVTIDPHATRERPSLLAESYLASKPKNRTPEFSAEASQQDSLYPKNVSQGYACNYSTTKSSKIEKVFTDKAGYLGTTDLGSKKSQSSTEIEPKSNVQSNVEMAEKEEQPKRAPCQTWICHEFSETGICHNPDCPFTHEEAPIKQHTLVEQKTEQKLECWSWTKSGVCRYGMQCSFRHDGPGKVFLCDNWKRTGKCKFGDRCRYRHEGSEVGKEMEHKQKIFVGGIPQSVKRSEDLREIFEREVGETIDALVCMDKRTGFTRGFGFVTFLNMEAARRALSKVIVINGRRLDCKIAKENFHEKSRSQVRRKDIKVRKFQSFHYFFFRRHVTNADS
mmetsp:Transcript_41569/g.67532  ORF Transcript_41569/g.67532 Transcript_41569/m.67532 type:complete len:470 (+) Transcript_41569:74-1483(+)